MCNNFKMLKLKLKEFDITQIYLAELMHCSYDYITHRMTGRRGWALQDMYFLMDLLNIPYSEMHIYFSKQDLQCQKIA